jgi:hypothetical protein
MSADEIPTLDNECLEELASRRSITPCRIYQEVCNPFEPGSPEVEDGITICNMGRDLLSQEGFNSAVECWAEADDCSGETQDLCGRPRDWTDIDNAIPECADDLTR